jgi:hypothetical protein
MIIGAVYKEDMGTMKAVPLLIDHTFRVCGFVDIDADDMVWVLSWSSRKQADDVVSVMAVSGEFFHLYRNKCHPKRSWSHYGEIAVFSQYASSAIDVQLGVQAQFAEQQEFWRRINSEVSSLPPGAHKEIAMDFMRWDRPEYTDQGISLHALSTQWNISREAIREVVLRETGKYPE